MINAITRRWQQWIAISVALCLLAGMSDSGYGQSKPPTPEDVQKEVLQLLQQAYKLTQEDKYDEALPLAERALAIAEKTFTPEHTIISVSLYQLGLIYQGKKDFTQAEALYKRSLAIAEHGREDEYIASPLQGLADLYFHKNEYDKAEPLYQRALAIWEKVYGTEHPAVVAALHRLASIYNERGDYDKAEQYAQRTLTLEEKKLGPEHLDIARTLHLLTEVYIKKKNYERADLSLQRMINIVEKAFAQDPQNVPWPAMLSVYADMYKKQGQYDRAESLYQRALEVEEKLGRPAYPDVATHIYSLAKLYDEKNDYPRAEAMYRRLLAIVEKARGPEHPDVAGEINNLAGLYDRKGDYDKSEPLYRRSLAILEKSPGSEQNLAYTLSSLAWVYLLKNDYNKAEPLFQRALAIAEKKFGLEHPFVALYLDGLARLYDRKREFDRAEPLYQRALTIREKANGPEHPDVARSLSNLAYIYQERGDYKQAELLYQRALTMREKILGPKHPDVAASLNNLAWMYDKQGDYGKVEPLFQRALAIREEALGPEHLDVALSLINLAGMYGARGDYARAESLYQRALAIREKLLGAEHTDVARTLSDLAWLYFEKRDYDKAEPLNRRALNIAEKTLGSTHPDLASILNQLALLYKGQGNFDKAEPLYQRALKIVEKAYGSDSPYITQTLHNLALLYIAKGEYAKAEPLMQRSLAIDEKESGPMDAGLAESLTSMAYLYAAEGDTKRAIDALTRGTEISERNIGIMLATATGTEEQKSAFMAMQAIANETYGAVSLHIQLAPSDPQAARLALTTILRRKGRVLDAVSGSIQALRRHLNPEDRALLDQLAKARAQFATIALNGSAKMNPAQYQVEVAKLEEQGQRLETAISARSAQSRIELQPVTLERIQAAVPIEAALVEIVSYQPFNLRYKKDSSMWGPWRYAAYALRHEGAPSWVDLGEAAAIDSDVAKLRAALSNPHRSDVKLLARTLDEKVMRPVRGLLGDTRMILLAPDGALNLIPFNALVDEQNRYLVENYSITYLTSGSDLLRLQVKTESKQPPVIMANPLFDTGSATPKSQSAATLSENRRAMDFAQMKFSPLPGTAGEAEALKTVLPHAQVWTGVQATEAALKGISGPSVLHVATHGFFLPDRKQTALTETRGLKLVGSGSSADGSPQLRAVLGENPLLRSGLALAGADQRQSEDGEDGILTALEATGLDLWGTKLVVLSACETGVGDVKNGDGVYGLRRALVLAGAESQVMSLWQVSDAATRDLMVAYYQRLSVGEGRTEALRQVQLEMIKSKERNHPFFWASFIQSGDWRSMDDKAMRTK